ncbi:hypothetical protein P8452_32599 [Trifolium repens]|nr:hypothetical protein P8452_32599 [Trifolium repens]
MNNQVVEDALNSLKDIIPKPNVAPDVATSLAQEEPTPDIVGDDVNVEKQVDDEPVSDKLVGTAANDETIVQQDDEEPADENVADGNPTDIPAADNAMSVDDDVVDVDAVADLHQTVSEVASGSIARKLRNKKGKDADVVEAAVTKATPSKKKKTIGPSRKPSKVEIASQKKKSSGKRKIAEVGDSDYEVEEDVPHIVSNIVSSAKKKSQEKLRRAASVPDHDVVDDVPNIVSTGKKKIVGKFIPQNVPDVPMDNISFHFIESAQKWKFVANRRLALERELSAEAFEKKEIIALIEKAGLLKTVTGMGECYEKLVKEFLVNIPEDCDNPLSKEHHKVYVRGKCVHFSPAVINKALGNKEDGYAKMEVTNNQVCKTITANQVKVWPLKGLARFIYSVGTGTVFNYGAHIFEETVQHAKSWAVRMPIAFPSLICSIILAQHPAILTADDEVSKRESPLDFHPRLFEGKHAVDIEFAGPSVMAAAPSSMNRKEMIASLEATCKALDEKKKSLEQVIMALKQEEAAEEGEDVQTGQEEGVNDDGRDTEELELSDSSAVFDGFHNFSVVTQSGLYRTTLHPYKIVFQSKTQLVSCEACDIPYLGLSFVDVAEICAHTRDYEYLVDVIGVMTGISAEREYIKDDKITKMVIIELTDHIGKCECALFGDYVDEVQRKMEKSCAGLPIVVVQYAKIKVFRDKASI